MKPSRRAKIIRALNQSLKIAIQHSLRKLRETNDDAVFEEALRRFYLNKGLPKDYENTLEMRYLSAYYRDSQKMQVVKQDLSYEQENEVCDRLLEVGMWLHTRWAPKVRTLVVKVCGGQENTLTFTRTLFDIKDRTPNGLHIGRMLNVILDA